MSHIELFVQVPQHPLLLRELLLRLADVIGTVQEGLEQTERVGL